MDNNDTKYSIYDISFAVDKLKNQEYEEAYKIIIGAICSNPNAPEPHNLLGLWYEINGQEPMARKHYRVAYVLDPTYKPACNNLERISTFFISKEIPLDFGVLEEQEIRNEKRDKQNDRKYNQ